MSEVQSLPCNVDAERFVLGSIMLDDCFFMQAAAMLHRDDFSIEKHRRIFKRMGELHERGERIDRVSVANELQKFSELESCDGWSYLTSLDDGMPRVTNLDSYIGIVKEKSNLRRGVFAAQHLMNRFFGEETFAQILTGFEKTLRSLGDGVEAKQSETISEIIESVGGISAFFKGKHGIPTPIVAITEATGGWKPGELSIVAARPSMGKSAFALNCVYNAAKRGVPTAFYSYEMAQEDIVTRLISYISGMTFMEIQSGDLNLSERRQVSDSIGEIQELPLRIIAASGSSVYRIRSDMERLHRRGLCGFAAIDYIGLIRSEGATDNRNRELGDICRQLKTTAGELAIPLMVLAQLNRAVESRTDKRPAMSDLRDSGELEEHADMISFLYRPEYYNRDAPELRGIAEFIIAKQRNGPTPIVKMEFDYRGGRFTDERTP